MNVAILMLCAGHSTRMGTPKQLLPIGNKTLLGLSIENAIHSKANRVFCVLGSQADVIQKSISHYDVNIIINPHFNDGLSSSIIAGITYLKDKNFDSVLILLGDQPKVDSNYINALILSSENCPTQIIASQYNKTLGVPAIFPKSYFNQLLQLKGDKGAKNFLNTQRTQAIAIESDKLIDIDTQDDYLNFLNSL
ncbi:nucleotidyltransferase family protein [Psychroserpens damuponensis]|uniref:nucleotidyltransferase family protein n=1 Tax=Psychroserpens damuponensis TaxID=943936 RepID=UPI0006946A57|nr:nucleotidyltransferase family protein [Psychroserpens damuponensis]